MDDLINKLVILTQVPTLDPWERFLYVFCDINKTKLWWYLYDANSILDKVSHHDDNDPDICRVGLYAWTMTREEIISDIGKAIAEKKAGNALCDDEDD